MSGTLEALLNLQSVERQIVEVRRELEAKREAVAAHRRRIEDLQADLQTLNEAHKARQKEAAAVELELKAREEEVAKLRASLRTAKTNKDYAAILTRINTLKADNSKFEEEGLRLIQAAEDVQEQAKAVERQIAEAKEALAEVERNSAEEVARLESALAALQQKRDEAARGVPAEALSVFERIARKRDGDAMARIIVVGDKPPYQYVCSGCNMSIRAEHANALRTRDEIRLCDCCRRILYLEETMTSQKA